MVLKEKRGKLQSLKAEDTKPRRKVVSKNLVTALNMRGLFGTKHMLV
jgi:hypothetical protein